MQFTPTERPVFKLGSRALSASWKADDSEEKGCSESQHVGVPELQTGGPVAVAALFCAGLAAELSVLAWLGSVPCCPVAAAATLLAKAMAATKEMMDLLKSIVKNRV